ncbi:MAG: hybrid sensor histidine kinase/response regulator, partial [Rubrivivax sp.]
MSDGPADFAALINALADVSARQVAAQAIASRLSAHRCLLYVQDPELPVMLPAPGMPKTLRAGDSWRALLARCIDEREVAGEVELESATWHAHALTESGFAFILVGPVPPQVPDLLRAAMPLLSVVLCAQQALRLGAAEAKDAREAAAHAHQLAQALDKARAAAADLNHQLQHEHRRKDEFLAMLAHELRNPLAPLTTAVEILRRSAGQPPEDRVLSMVSRQVQQLTHLVDDLMDVSRVSRGLIELRHEALRLEDVIGVAVESSRPLIETGRHALHVEGDAKGCWIRGDRVRLTQVFSNLLNNAAKYTEPGGHIWVRCRQEDGAVRVSVEDNGTGIQPGMLESIFEMFTQAPGSLDRAPGGLGIGLTLVRTLVRLHGGAVHATSAGPGLGSSFIVRLPLVDAPAEALPALAQDGVREGAHVLVVDDNVDAADAIAEVLRLVGVRVSVAHDGAQALAQAATAPPFDLVLMDIGLPGQDGYETAREWRRRFGPDSRLVALTGYGSAEDKRRSAHAGFNGHLVKPVSLEDLLAALEP